MKRFINVTIKGYLNENKNLDIKVKEIEQTVNHAKSKFMDRISIFNDIIFKWLDGDNFVGEYEYNSSLDGTPTIYLYKDYILNLPEDEIEFAVNTTIYHELGHAMANIDNHYIFKKDENILNYTDEEEWVEEFAFQFEMFNKIPDGVIELSNLFKEKKWIGIDENSLFNNNIY